MPTRISIRPSALGSKGLLLFAALELAFLATNYSNLFFLMLAFSAVLGLFGGFWAHRNLRHLQVLAVEAAPAASNTSRAIQVQLASDKRPRFDLVVELQLPGGYAEVGYTPCLISTANIAAAVAGQARGVHQLAHVRITSGFPFGFFVARTRLPIAAELITYPTPAPLGERGTAGNRAGEQGTLAAGRGAALAGLRAFRTGDSLSDVHWKATARRGKAVVKEREREAEPAVHVVLDRRCDDESFERALSHATTLVLAARHGAPVQLLSQGVEFLVDPDRGGANDALRWLAAATPLPLDAASPPKHPTAMHLPESPRTV